MSTIVFTAPPLTLEERYGTLAGAGNTLPSMGLLYLASVVRKNGYKTGIVEASSLGLNYEEALKQILSFSPDYVGITATTVSIFHAAKLAGKIKEKNKEISIIIIEHDMAVIERIADRVYVFNYGKKIAEGSYSLVSRNQAVLDAYLGEEGEDVEA